ncbi:sporulation protein YjcZ [Lysinibacillus xylanilyticus]
MGNYNNNCYYGGGYDGSKFVLYILLIIIGATFMY